MRGAWIEILVDSESLSISKRRSPCGERGLKFIKNLVKIIIHLSLPMRGAWIEIEDNHQKVYYYTVAPHAGSVD